ncbi:phosphatidylinositol-specific phospholipase C domain-containing protein [Amycolatopsis minnesotensis]|uniref:Phosphatidylinositol-specific phospholipase C domain-containing protein n=1 Tax=Amycolatopsis minnesotensis TaxID=337894 RepID=A0ABP5BD00_9PSEU
MRRFAVVAAGVLVAGALAGTANADPAKFSGGTAVGVHNTYETGTYDYLARALDAGTGLIELDVWPDIFTKEWKVSHSNPFGNGNNCVAASSPAELYTGGRNKNLEHCLDDIRIWFAAHPDKGPLVLKLEMKTGFSANTGLGPEQIDRTFRDHLGSAVYRPSDLLGGHASLDEASKSDAWPSREALKGKVIVEVIPGTVEEGNPTDTLKTDVEYAGHLRSLAAAGKLGDGQIFPAVHGAAGGDPRTRYSDAGLRPWFVAFDGDASAYVTGIDTSFYDRNHYLLVMTDAHNVTPKIDSRNPTERQASDRAAQLAKAHASVLTSDWAGLSPVLGKVLPRG